jgi:hypothetical protein
MSKTDAMRALREARQAQLRAAASNQSATTPYPAAAPARRAPVRAARLAAVPDVPDVPDVPSTPEPGENQDLCGHRSMGGKTCQRPAGHEQANHRYKP